MNPEFYHMNDDVLVKYLLGETTQQEAAQVRNWLAAHPDHQKHFDHLIILWEESRHQSVHSSIDEDVAWNSFKDRIHRSQKKRSFIPKMSRYGWIRIAALFIVIAGCAMLYFISQPKPIQTLTFQTAKLSLVDTLPDGSVVTLNKNSQISYPEKFAKESRKIDLKGEAFFDVKPNKRSPFLIQVNDVIIKVVGTSFNVRSNKGSTEVIVETGVVQVMRNKKVVVLHPNERITVKEMDSTLIKTVEKDQLYHYYRTKEFVCDHTPLWKLVAALNEAYDSKIVIGRHSLRNQPLTVTFKNESLETILKIISETLEIDVIQKDGQIVLQ